MEKSILVVDDNVDLLDALSMMIGRAGYNVKTSTTGKEIFDDAEKPGLILLDAYMANIDGRDICKRVKSTKETNDIPVIMISASPDIATTAINAGADDFIEKPFNKQTLLNKIARLFSV